MALPAEKLLELLLGDELAEIGDEERRAGRVRPASHGGRRRAAGAGDWRSAASGRRHRCHVVVVVRRGAHQLLQVTAVAQLHRALF